MKKTVSEAINHALRAMGIAEGVPVEVEIPKAESHGDLSTPVAMTLVKTLRRKPREIADEIVNNLPETGAFERIEIAGPGFINFAFTKEYLAKSLHSVLKDGLNPMKEDIGRGRRVQIEFVSANPTGPLHLGHGRGAAVGAALANIMRESGFVIESEYYINDAGRQARLLGESVFARYREILGVPFEFPEEGYRGDYVSDIAQALLKREGDRHKSSVFGDVKDVFIGFSIEMMMDLIKTDLAAFGVGYETWQSEKELYASGEVEKTIEYLKNKGLIFEEEGALWFRATAFGDDKDRVVRKSDGDYTYFASDIAYHMLKIEKGFDEFIDIWGADHHGYVPRLEAVIEALGYERKKLRVILVQMVSLLRGGQPVQMSKRAGEFVTLRSVMDEVGPDITKFIFLTRRSDSHLEFDLELAKAQSAENPVFYVQYANARINSILKYAKEQELSIEGDVNLMLLNEEQELRLIKKILQYPMTLSASAINREPHRLMFFLQELAGLFHQFYNLHRVVTEDIDLSRARLFLLTAVRAVILDGLRILGISAPDKM